MGENYISSSTDTSLKPLLALLLTTKPEQSTDNTTNITNTVQETNWP